MGQRNITFTGWQQKGHLIDEQSVDITLSRRLYEAGVVGDLAQLAKYGPFGHPVPTRDKNRAKAEAVKPLPTSFKELEREVRWDTLRGPQHSFEAKVLRIQPGFQMTVTEIIAETRALGYQIGGLVHLLEIAESHRDSLVGVSRVLGLGSLLASAQGAATMPYLDVEFGADELSLTIREMHYADPAGTYVSGHANQAFIVLEGLSHLSGQLGCRECGSQPIRTPGQAC